MKNNGGPAFPTSRTDEDFSGEAAGAYRIADAMLEK